MIKIDFWTFAIVVIAFAVIGFITFIFVLWNLCKEIVSIVKSKIVKLKE